MSYNDKVVKYGVWSEKFRWYYYPFALSIRAYVIPQRILDIGCGPGVFTEVLRDVFPRSLVVGVDTSSEMCKASKCVRGDAHRLPFKSRTFELVTLHFTLHDLEIDRAFREIRRILKDKGFLAIRDLNSEMPRIARSMLLEALERNIDKDYALYISKKIDDFLRPREISRKLSKNFEIKRICESFFDFDIIAMRR